MLLRAPMLVIAACVIAGCDKVQSDFVLRLEPLTPLDQRPFDADPSVRLVIDDAGGSTVMSLDVGDDGPARTDLPPLEDAWLGLLLEVPAQSGTAYDPSTLHAWGEDGPFDLAKDEEVHATVLVAEYAAIGDLEVLPAGTGTVGAALALTPSGDAWLFGGADVFVPPPQSTLALSRQLRLNDWNEGDWQFVDAGTMPSVLGASARFEPTATVVDTDDGPAILVTGGRVNGSTIAGNLQTAFLLDTTSAEVSWSGATTEARSGHVALRMDNGRVLVIGGYEGTEIGTEPTNASFEVFAAEWLAFDGSAERLEVPARGFAVASLGPDGVLVCGGAVAGANPNDPRVPSAACQRVSLLGNLQSAEDLPVALADLAMAPAGPGKVLACGGIDAEVSDAAVGAIGRAWLYDAALDGWTEVGTMAHPRARHTLVGAPSGHVIVIGGSETVGPEAYDVGAAVECVEEFDPVTGLFVEVECTGTGSGARPPIADGGRGLALVLSGLLPSQTTGRGYGVVGLGPDL